MPTRQQEGPQTVIYLSCNQCWYLSYHLSTRHPQDWQQLQAEGENEDWPFAKWDCGCWQPGAAGKRKPQRGPAPFTGPQSQAGSEPAGAFVTNELLEQLGRQKPSVNNLQGNICLHFPRLSLLLLATTYNPDNPEETPHASLHPDVSKAVAAVPHPPVLPNNWETSTVCFYNSL